MNKPVNMVASMRNGLALDTTSMWCQFHSMKPKLRQVTLRIPEELHEALKEYADEQRRSVQNIVLITIERLTRKHRARMASMEKEKEANA